jgi:hypothetical protein
MRSKSNTRNSRAKAGFPYSREKYSITSYPFFLVVSMAAASIPASMTTETKVNCQSTQSVLNYQGGKLPDVSQPDHEGYHHERYVSKDQPLWHSVHTYNTD